MIAAGHPAHMSAALAQTFAGSAAEVRSFPVTLPVAEIVAGLNEWQPAMLLGYPTALALLAAEARAGRLRISPRRVIASSEPLLPETRQALEQAFGAPVANMYGTSEAGPMAVGCWRGPGMHLCDDLVIIEPADQDGAPGPARHGVRQGLRDGDLEPGPAADPVRADRPGHGHRHGLSRAARRTP